MDCLNCSKLCLRFYEHDWTFKHICIHSSSSIVSPRSSSHFCLTCFVSLGKVSINPWYSLEINFRGLSDCSKIVSIFEASGLSSVCCTERIKCYICKSSPQLRHWLVFPGCLTLLRPLSPSILLRWDMTKNYLGVHLYIILSNNIIKGLIIEMTIIPRFQTLPYPSTQDGTMYPFTDCYNILKNSPELRRLVFPDCLTLLGHLSPSDPATTWEG